jgi:hypothetical protein
VSRISKHVTTQQTSGRSAGNGHPADAARQSPLRTNMAPERSVGGPFDAGRPPGPANAERSCRADRFVTKLTYSYPPSRGDGPCDQHCSTAPDPAAHRRTICQLSEISCRRSMITLIGRDGPARRDCVHGREVGAAAASTQFRRLAFRALATSRSVDMSCFPAQPRWCWRQRRLANLVRIEATVVRVAGAGSRFQTRACQRLDL